MTDKANVPEAGSIDNPLGPSPEEAASKWKKMLEVASPHSISFVEEASSQMLPALELAEKLGTQANALMLAMQLVQKGIKGDSANDVDKEKIVVLIERVRPILTLKETLDVYISNSCEHLLDELEKA